MSLSASAFCTLSELKDYIGIGGTHRSGFLEEAIEDASRRIIDRLGYDPHSDTYTAELRDGDNSHEMITTARPITTITNIYLWDGDTYDAIDSDDLAQMQNRDWYIDGVDYVFEKGRSNYKLAYVAGYSETECDKRFRLTCMRIAGVLQKESGKTGHLGMASQSFGDGSRTTYEDAIEGFLDDLQMYRRLTP